MVIYVKLTKEEKRLAREFAKKNNSSLSKAMKKSFFEKIEEEYDIAIADSALREHEKNPITISHEEVKHILDL